MLTQQLYPGPSTIVHIELVHRCVDATAKASPTAFLDERTQDLDGGDHVSDINFHDSAHGWIHRGPPTSIICVILVLKCDLGNRCTANTIYWIS
jgi:hypothetical protein